MAFCKFCLTQLEFSLSHSPPRLHSVSSSSPRRSHVNIMASSSSSAAAPNERQRQRLNTTANLIGGRLVSTLPLLPSKVYPPPPSLASVPYRRTNTFINNNNAAAAAGGRSSQSPPLVLQVSPATSPKVNRSKRWTTPPSSPRSLPATLSPLNYRRYRDFDESQNEDQQQRRRKQVSWSPDSNCNKKSCNNNKPDAQRIDLWGTSECESGHQGLIHDIQINFDGSKMATASEDKTIKVFDVDPKTDVIRCAVTLRGHQGPVWKLSWADPSMGNILASASADGTVKVWREGKSMSDLNYGEECWYLWREFLDEQNTKSETALLISAPPNAAFSVSWAPRTFGLALACGYSNGYVCVYTYEDDQWKSNKFRAHSVSVKAVSWAPASSRSMESLTLCEDDLNEVFRFATCGEADICVKIWRYEGEAWTEETRLNGLMSYVKDVAWSPDAKTMRIAACGADMRVVIWSFGKKDWQISFSTLLYEDPWIISWNSLGDQLVVSQTDNQIFVSKIHSNSEDDDEKDSWTLQNINSGS